MVLLDFSEFLNIVSDSQYAERIVLYIELPQDDLELALLFAQIQVIRNRSHPFCITHNRSHRGLPVRENAIDQLLVGNCLQVPEFHKKYHTNSKV